MELNKHEIGFLNFVEPAQSRRLSALLTAGPKGRRKFNKLLAHNIQLNPQYSRLVDSNLSAVDDILSLLRKFGAGNQCYVLSEIQEIDRQSLDLIEALNASVGNDAGTFVSSIPGKLGYFEYEDIGERYLLTRQID